jgi:hypothetical protein
MEQSSLVITLEGPGVVPGQVSLGALAILADSIQKAVQRVTVSLRGKNSGRRKSNELLLLSEFRLVAIKEGSAQLVLEPAIKPLSPEAESTRAIQSLINGIDALTQNGAHAEDESTSSVLPTQLPHGFDASVLRALLPMEQLYQKYGVTTLSMQKSSVNGLSQEPSPAMEPTEATMHRPLFEKMQALSERFRPPQERKVVGRLLMADFKNQKCKIWDPSGHSHLVMFDAAISDGIESALRSWVEVVLTPNDDDDSELEFVSGIMRLSDDEVDELSPPRAARWPKAVFDALRNDTERAVGWTEKSAALPPYELQD